MAKILPKKKQEGEGGARASPGAWADRIREAPGMTGVEFIQRCYQQRVISEKAEERFVRLEYARLLGDSRAGIRWQLLQGDLYYAIEWHDAVAQGRTATYNPVLFARMVESVGLIQRAIPERIEIMATTATKKSAPVKASKKEATKVAPKAAVKPVSPVVARQAKPGSAVAAVKALVAGTPSLKPVEKEAKPVAKPVAKNDGEKKWRIPLFGTGAGQVVQSLAAHYDVTPLQIIAGFKARKIPVKDGTVRIQATPSFRKGCTKITGKDIEEFARFAKGLA